MCLQRLSKRVERKSRPSKLGWKVVPQSRTGSRETPVAKFVVCSWHKHLPDVVGMRPQRATTSVRQKMTVVSKILYRSINQKSSSYSNGLSRITQHPLDHFHQVYASSRAADRLKILIVINRVITIFKFF